MQALAKIAFEIIKNNRYMTIATASVDGKPWISPVFFAYDESYNLFWISNKNSQHSHLIRNNPQIAIVIFDSSAQEGDGDAVYIEGKALEVSDAHEIKLVIPIYNARATLEEYKPKNITDVMGDAVWRIYKAVPKNISKLAENEYINGQCVNKRAAIKLSDLRAVKI